MPSLLLGCLLLVLEQHHSNVSAVVECEHDAVEIEGFSAARVRVTVNGASRIVWIAPAGIVLGGVGRLLGATFTAAAANVARAF